jgi:hypothetical protein
VQSLLYLFFINTFSGYSEHGGEPGDSAWDLKITHRIIQTQLIFQLGKLKIKSLMNSFYVRRLSRVWSCSYPSGGYFPEPTQYPAGIAFRLSDEFKHYFYAA